jgi:dipeptidyl-peptidase-4
MTDAASKPSPQENRPGIPLEAVTSYPLPGTGAPSAFQFSPDDRLITYLYSPEHNLVTRLYAYDPASGKAWQMIAADAGVKEEDLTIEERLRRERVRQRELGVTSYSWARHEDRILAPLGGDLFCLDGAESAPRRVASTSGKPFQDPQISPDGGWIAYVQDAELYVIPAAGGEARQITHGARETGMTHGLAEYAAQEEMDRRHGYWWSPDSQRIAFTEVDERHIPVYPIVHQNGESPFTEEHRYPFAGGPNAIVRLGVVSLAGGDTVWMDLRAGQEFYIGRVRWFADGALSAQVVNRAQSQLDLLRLDPATGSSTLLLRENSQVWINLNDLFRPLKSGQFIWGSERSGFRHLYLCDANGKLERQLTSGEWLVDAVAGVDENRGLVYFTASRESPLESQLYAVSLNGGEARRLTFEAGMHAVVCDHALQRFIDTYQSTQQPPVVSLRSLSDGARLAAIYQPDDPREKAPGLQIPEIVSLENRSGTRLYGAIFRPPAEYGPGPYATIVLVYGGPHAQMVKNSWDLTVVQSMRAQYLASRGYLVFKLDNRGSARRGLEFEAALRHDMGHHEVEDQVDGVRWLVSQGLADPQRVGITGGSYGGYMSAMCLMRAPETFRAAAAISPVTAWDGYDTCYTERYMSTPQSNPQGYEAAQAMSHVDQMSGKLLLVHGLIDENVHFRHTARLINALIHARKPYELLVFPDERHMPRGLADRIYMEVRISGFFDRSLRAD